MSDTLIKVEGVSKKFCRSLKKSLWYGMQDLGNEMLGKCHGGNGKLRSDEFWAVNDVSFEIKRGECLGLIGPNGAGKSTLLKMLNGLIKPDKGRIEMSGHVRALIELGSGFNPILTGRENIYVNGSVLGFSKAEIDRKLDAIIDFAKIDEFIDSPVQNYSSGMKVRLGFAVAAQMDPDVLIIDEVLAVGDAGFRTKCYNLIAELSERAAIIFVSHSMQYVARLSRDVLVLRGGEMLFYGQAAEAINCYYNVFEGDKCSRHGSGEAKVTSLIIDRMVQPQPLNFSQPLIFDITIESREQIDDLVVDITFRNLGSELVVECNNFVRRTHLSLERNKRYLVQVEVPENLLNPGVYYVSTLLMSADMIRHYDWVRNITKIEVTGGRPGSAGAQMNGKWKISPLQ